MSEQPKACPFCGWGTIVDEPFWLPNKHICKCNACGARTRICRTWEDAVRLWNKRQTEQNCDNCGTKTEACYFCDTGRNMWTPQTERSEKGEDNAN